MIVSSSLKNIYIHCDLKNIRNIFLEDLEILKAMTNSKEISEFIKYLYNKYKNPVIRGLIQKMGMCKNIPDLFNYVDRIHDYVGIILK